MIVLELFAEDSRRNVYAGELDVRPPGAPTTTGAGYLRRRLYESKTDTQKSAKCATLTAKVVTREAIVHVTALFPPPSGAGTQMVIHATEGLEEPMQMALSYQSLTSEWLAPL